MRIAPPDILAARRGRLARLLAARNLDALVVTCLPNIAYLTGFFASAAALVVAPDALRLVGDGRYREALAARAGELVDLRTSVLPAGLSYDQALVDQLLPFRGLRVGFETAHLTVGRYRYLVGALAEQGWTVPLVETEGIVEALRIQKDDWEIARLRDAATRLSAVAKYILSKALAGRTEAEVASEIESHLRQAGFERPAFDTIVAAGANAARPHGRPGMRRIEAGELVVLDFGGVLDGYHTDLTRTVAIPPARAHDERLIAEVVAAQAAAFAMVRPGAQPEQVDEAARDRLAREGLADAFTHGTGHGVGLEIHEAPRVTRARAGHAEPPLAAGMTLTLEPGVYFPGSSGVRIEDDVLVTDSGAEWLTEVPRTW